MKRFWLRVSNDDNEWYYVFDCKCNRINDLWEIADVFSRKGFNYSVDMVDEDVDRDDIELPF